MKFSSSIHVLEWFVTQKLTGNQQVSKQDRQRNSYDGPVCESVDIERIIASLCVDDQQALFCHVLTDEPLSQHSGKHIDDVLMMFENALNDSGYLNKQTLNGLN